MNVQQCRFDARTALIVCNYRVAWQRPSTDFCQRRALWLPGIWSVCVCACAIRYPGKVKHHGTDIACSCFRMMKAESRASRSVLLRRLRVLSRRRTLAPRSQVRWLPRAPAHCHSALAEFLALEPAPPSLIVMDAERRGEASPEVGAEWMLASGPVAHGPGPSSFARSFLTPRGSSQGFSLTLGSSYELPPPFSWGAFFPLPSLSLDGEREVPVSCSRWGIRPTGSRAARPGEAGPGKRQSGRGTAPGASWHAWGRVVTALLRSPSNRAAHLPGVSLHVCLIFSGQW